MPVTTSISVSIAFILPSLGVGGAEYLSINQINYLHQHKYRVYLLVLSPILDLLPELQIPPSHITVVKNANAPALNISSLKQSTTIVPQISRFLKQHQIHTVFANMPMSHFFMRCVKVYELFKWKKNAFQLFCYYHGMQYAAYPLNTMGKKVFNQANSLLAYFTDDASIFVSKAVQDDAAAFFYLRNPHVVYNSVPYKIASANAALRYLEETQISVQNNRYVMVFPGRFHPEKGHLFFLKALTKFIQTQQIKPSQLLLIIIGDGKLRTTIEKNIADLSLSNYCHITGYVANDLLLSFMQLSNLVVVPSINEGFGNVAVEALMQSTLVLASDAGGLKEILEDGKTGFVFEKNNEQALLQKLTYIYKHFSTISSSNATQKGRGLLDKTTIYQAYESRFTLAQQMQQLLNLTNNKKTGIKKISS